MISSMFAAHIHANSVPVNVRTSTVHHLALENSWRPIGLQIGPYMFDRFWRNALRESTLVISFDPECHAVT